MDKQPTNYLDLEIEDDNPQWMKLVDYVNQREEETFPVPNHFTYENRFDDVHIFSKRMWFVKWLVENDKIDNDKLEVAYENEEDLYIGWDVCRDYRFILMLLSIQDNPMTFMLSILK